MSGYTGDVCPVCGKVFSDNDDVVVCPDCGTPHHRACYNQLGHCANIENHAPGYSWQPKKQPEEESFAETVVCARCGTPNSPAAASCVLCGYPLADHAQGAEEPPRAQQAQSAPPAAAPSTYAEFVSSQKEQAAKRLGMDNPTDKLTDDITIGEFFDFVGPNNLSFVYKFRSMLTRGGITFNLSAFFFTGLYCFYRKMYRLGAAVTSLYLAAYAYYFYNVMPYMVEYLSTGVMSQSGAAYDTAIAAASIVRGITVGLSVLLGVLFNRMYMGHCISSIRTLKDSGSVQYTTGCTGGYRYCLARKGGTDRITVILVVALVFVAYLVYTYFLMNKCMPS